ncbi:MAG: hypothetical protein H6Q65_1576 [Firmicutes bacterium]|nr:hypothetical protein [Bacillota bacterium]
MRIALVQMQANDIRDFQVAVDKLLNMTCEAAKKNDLVIVPECAFPAYYIEPREINLSLVLGKTQYFLEKMKEIAKKNHSYIAFGYVEKDNDRLYNTALLIDREGKEVVKKHKSYLWHFDHLWFSEGEDLATADTDFGKVALIICCDARSPEIVRMAALAGADLIIDLANLTATGPNISELQNAQSAYLLSVRAMENGVWIAMADKWGVETHNITYAGRSAVYNPEGNCLYQAGSDADEIVSVEIPAGKDGRILRENNTALPVRRPDLYELLAAPTDELPVKKVIEQPVCISEITPYITAVTGELSAQDYVAMVQRLGVHGSRLICMPPSRLAIKELQRELCAVMASEVMVVATMIEGETTKSYILQKEGIVADYENAHKNGGKPFVLAASWGNVGLLHEEEGLIPEWARCIMLAGADCLLWPNRLPSSVVTPVARTRAAENRMFVVVVQSETSSALGQIIDPNGIVLASTLENQTQQACGTYACFANSRMKNIVPGTHVIYNRHPQAYKRLVRGTEKAD